MPTVLIYQLYKEVITSLHKENIFWLFMECLVMATKNVLGLNCRISQGTVPIHTIMRSEININSGHLGGSVG